MICQGYKAPDIIDPKLLDPKYALEGVEEEVTGSTERITSLKRLLTNKVNRDGYADDATQNVFHEIELSEFLQSADPHEYLSSFNRIKMDAAGLAMIADLKPPGDLESFCMDLKCCGRRELSELLKLRYKFNVATDRAKKSEKEARKALEPEVEQTQEEIEALVDK
jgi:AdoMet-dependent rRNA methyltransferase SPB1